MGNFQAKMDFMTHPSWQVRSGRGRWVCPFCARETDVEYPEGEPDAAWSGVERHLSLCKAYDGGEGAIRPPDELMKNKQRGERVNRVAKRVAELFRDDAVWQAYSPEGLWECPFCGHGVGNIELSQDPVQVRRSAVNIAKHLLFACQLFQEASKNLDLDHLDEVLEQVPERDGPHHITTIISLNPQNLQRLADSDAPAAPAAPIPAGAPAPMPGLPANAGVPPLAAPGVPAVPLAASPFAASPFAASPFAASPAQQAGAGDVTAAIPVSPSFAGQLAQDLNASMTKILEEQSQRGGSSPHDRLAEEARRKQQRMLPPPPEVEGMEIGVVYQPCDMVGGDFYDFIDIKGKHLGIVQGDVSGHGIEVWGDMAIGMKTMRIYAKTTGNHPAEMLKNSNEDLVPDLMAKTFISAFYCVLDIDTFKCKMARAGHNPMILFNPNRKPDSLTQHEPKGMVLGMARGDRFDAILEEIELQLYSGDVLLWYTDGVTEAMDAEGDEYGIERLCDCVRNNGQFGAGALLDAILRDVTDFTNGRDVDDDITMVALHIH